MGKVNPSSDVQKWNSRPVVSLHSFPHQLISPFNGLNHFGINIPSNTFTTDSIVEVVKLRFVIKAFAKVDILTIG